MDRRAFLISLALLPFTPRPQQVTIQGIPVQFIAPWTQQWHNGAVSSVDKVAVKAAVAKALKGV